MIELPIYFLAAIGAVVVLAAVALLVQALWSWLTPETSA